MALFFIEGLGDTELLTFFVIGGGSFLVRISQQAWCKHQDNTACKNSGKVPLCSSINIAWWYKSHDKSEAAT